ncbi:hypothetical protein QP932_08260 [Corynebacterium freneyi]|uniref:hypothetical protein n=1 Tax=Corynebacterium freneyi TaxID=134034 RepID=UPI002551972B|nr:hypothetical protein [Corynebacterium freneyi]MDK8768492.1 hypothetical protein [Corynebacterium freneyi]
MRNDDTGNDDRGHDDMGAADDFDVDYSGPAPWKRILASVAVIVGVIAFIAAIVWRGWPGVAIGAALAGGMLLPAGWWLWHEHRERRAAADPEAPAAVLDRRWRFIAPISVVLLAVGSVLAFALPAPDDEAPPVEEETTSHRTPPKPSSTSKSRSAPPRTTTTFTETTTTPTSSESSESDTSTSSSTRPTTSESGTTTEPTTAPTQSPEPTTQPPEPTTQPTTQPTQPTQPPQPTTQPTQADPAAGAAIAPLPR